MADYLNIVLEGGPISVPPSDRLNLPGEWRQIVFDHDISDGGGHHVGASPLIGNGGAARIVNGKLILRLEDFQPGVELQLRQYEVDADTGDRLETHEPDEFYTASEPPPVDADGSYLYPPRTHRHEHVFSYINSGHQFGLEISQWPHDLSAPTGIVAFAQLVATLEVL